MWDSSQLNWIADEFVRQNMHWIFYLRLLLLPIEKLRHIFALGLTNHSDFLYRLYFDENENSSLIQQPQCSVRIMNSFPRVRMQECALLFWDASIRFRHSFLDHFPFARITKNSEHTQLFEKYSGYFKHYVAINIPLQSTFPLNLIKSHCGFLWPKLTNSDWKKVLQRN